MNEISQVVLDLEYKVKALTNKYHALVAANDSLVKELESLSLENTSLLDALKSAEEKQKALRTANTLLGSNENKRETKHKINSLLKMLDTCIAGLAE